MTKRTILGTAAVATVLAATLSTAALADRGGPGRMGDAMGDGPGGFALMQFDVIDADKDGKITEAELDAHRAAQVAALDANGDGKVDAAELKARQMARAEERATEAASRMIARMDTDGDGLLSAAELVMPAPPARLFDRLDADNDGAVSRAEVEAAQARMAERMGEGRGEGRGRGKDGEGRRWWGMGHN